MFSNGAIANKRVVFENGTKSVKNQFDFKHTVNCAHSRSRSRHIIIFISCECVWECVVFFFCHGIHSISLIHFQCYICSGEQYCLPIQSNPIESIRIANVNLLNRRFKVNCLKVENCHFSLYTMCPTTPCQSKFWLLTSFHTQCVQLFYLQSFFFFFFHFQTATLIVTR